MPKRSAISCWGRFSAKRMWRIERSLSSRVETSTLQGFNGVDVVIAGVDRADSVSKHDAVIGSGGRGVEAGCVGVDPDLESLDHVVDVGPDGGGDLCHGRGSSELLGEFVLGVAHGQVKFLGGAGRVNGVGVIAQVALHLAFDGAGNERRELHAPIGVVSIDRPHHGQEPHLAKIVGRRIPASVPAGVDVGDVGVELDDLVADLAVTGVSVPQRRAHGCARAAGWRSRDLPDRQFGMSGSTGGGEVRALDGAEGLGRPWASRSRTCVFEHDRPPGRRNVVREKGAGPMLRWCRNGSSPMRRSPGCSDSGCCLAPTGGGSGGELTDESGDLVAASTRLGGAAKVSDLELQIKDPADRLSWRSLAQQLRCSAEPLEVGA